MQVEVPVTMLHPFHSCTDLEESLGHYWGKGLKSQSMQHLSDDHWLKEWKSISADNLTIPLVPDQACFIHTPLVVASWRCVLKEYPNQQLAQFFLNGISEGFKIGHNYGSVHLKISTKESG